MSKRVKQKRNKVNKEVSEPIRQTRIAMNTKNLFKNAGIELKDSESTWEDLTNLYNIQAEGLRNLCVSLNDQVDIIQKYNIKVDAEFNTLLRGIGGDMEALTIELNEIKELHAGKEGAAKTEDDFIEQMVIGEKYGLFAAKMQNVIMTPIVALAEKIIAERNRIYEEQKINILSKQPEDKQEDNTKAAE